MEMEVLEVIWVKRVLRHNCFLGCFSGCRAEFQRKDIADEGSNERICGKIRGID